MTTKPVKEMAEARLIQIVTGAQGSFSKGIKHILYALDDDGKVWALNPRQNKWERVHNPIDGEFRHGPEDPGDEIPSWRGL